MKAVSGRVLDAAINWRLDLDCDGSAAQRNAFERWHAADEEHARAWAQLNQLDQRFAVAARPARQALVQPRARLRAGRQVLGVALLLGLSLYAAQRSSTLDYWLADERSATGEVRFLQLADGTRVELNTHSAIDLAFDAHTRRIVLRQGEIYVQTGHGDPRPFVVQTRDGQLRALGTQFLVGQEAGGTRLGVVQSAVAARPEHKQDEQVIQAGHQVLVNADGITDATALPAGAEAWTHGMLVVDNVRLADLIGQLSRYRSGVLRVDPAVADLRISGSFPLTDTDLALAALSPALPVRIERHTRWWVTVKPAPVTPSK